MQDILPSQMQLSLQTAPSPPEDEGFKFLKIVVFSSASILTVLYGWLWCSLRNAEDGLFARWLAGLMCLCNVLLIAMMGLTIPLHDNALNEER
jgi:hypothetical protein